MWALVILAASFSASTSLDMHHHLPTWKCANKQPQRITIFSGPRSIGGLHKRGSGVGLIASYTMAA